MPAPRHVDRVRRLCLLAWCGFWLTVMGCQGLRMPWAANAGLPPQSEPRLTNDAK